MNKNTYEKYERDGVRPLPATLDEICKRLGIAPEVLLETSPHSMSQEESRNRAHSGFAEPTEPGKAAREERAFAERTGHPLARDASSYNARVSKGVCRLAAILARARGSRSNDTVKIGAVFNERRDDPIRRMAVIVAEVVEKAWSKKLRRDLAVSITGVSHVLDEIDAAFRQQPSHNKHASHCTETDEAR